MLKRRPIDKYIQQVTAGLPRLERVDTAAEIRVHLLQKTRELMAQGFPREEAEHLAVQEMGPVAATNRALIGHLFTSSLGWVVVGLMLTGAGIWTYLERDTIFWQDAYVGNGSLQTRELELAMRQIPYFQKLPKLVKPSFFLPRGTQTLEYAIISKRGHYQATILGQNSPPEHIADINRKPHQLSLLIGEGLISDTRNPNARGLLLETSIMSMPETEFKWSLGFVNSFKTFDRNAFGRIWTTQTLPTQITSVIPWDEVKLNVWAPIFLLAPNKKTTVENGNFIEPNPDAPEALLVAVRASSLAEHDLKASKLQFSSRENESLNQSNVKIIETPLPQVKRDVSVFHQGDPMIGKSFAINATF